MKKNKFILVVLLLIFAMMIVAMPAVSAGPSPSISLDVSFTGPDRSPDEYGVYGGGGAGYGMYCLSATVEISGLAPPKMDPERETEEGWRSGGFEVLFFSGSNVDDPDLEVYRVPLETVESDGDGGTYTYDRCRIPQETGQWKIVVTAWGPYSSKVETTRISETAGPSGAFTIWTPDGREVTTGGRITRSLTHGIAATSPPAISTASRLMPTSRQRLAHD